MSGVDRAELAEVLSRTQNPDGGWGYYAGKASRLEPTCWSLLARGVRQHSRAVEALRTWPTAEGLLLEQQGGGTNYGFHGLALLTLAALGVPHVAGLERLASAMERAKGVALADSPANRQNNSLQAWSWVADTFSWVEPTAYCLLALKLYARRTGSRVDTTRIDIAERMLLDRVCQGGGWNYGNANVLGKELHPYVPTTALALLAMQDRRNSAAVSRSLSWLEQHAVSERSSLALALTCIALAVYGRPTAGARAALLEVLPVTMQLEQIVNVAASHYALDDSHGHAAFRL